MITSLAEELKRLAVPQTSLLVHSKKKASLLFDPKEAAGFDRGTFYEIGLTGFEELKKFNPHFEVFGSTLFSSSSQGLERAVESRATNKKLNETIRRFLIRLSPYFLLRPAHQALEWLINRFHIHEYNKDDLLLLILPYHETKMFIKVLQLLNLKNEASPWHWLRPIQKPGVPLSKTAVLNHCASDASFLKFVCDGVVSSVKELGNEAACLVTTFAFFCSTLVGTLESCTHVTELQLTTILPVLLKGLSSPVADFALASFMITAQLVSKARLAQEILIPIINKVAKNPTSSSNTERATLLAVLYQTQTKTLQIFPTKALLHLSNHSWFPGTLNQLVSAGGNVTQLLVPLMVEALKVTQANIEEAASIKIFTENLVSSVLLDENDAALIIRTVVESIDGHKVLQEAAAKDDKRVDDNEFMQWYSKLLKQLERRYPGPYDKAMKEMLKIKKMRKKLQAILDFCDTGSMLDKLNHPVSKVRLQAVEYIVKNFSKLKVQDKQALKHTLSERLRDDDHAVVGKILELGMNALLSVVDLDFLLECLISLAVRYWQSADQPPSTTQKVLQLLCSFRVTEPGLIEAQILIALFPYLFPISAEEMPFVTAILKSEFASSNSLLIRVREGLSAIDHDLQVDDVSAIVWEHLRASYLPDVATLSKAVDTVLQSSKDVSRHLLSILLMANAVPKNDARTSLTILNNSIKIVEESRMYVEEVHMNLNGRTVPLLLLAAKEGMFAVQAFIYCLVVLMRNMSVPPHLKETRWWNLSGNTDNAAAFFVRMFEVLITGCNLEDSDMKKLYVEGMREYFKLFFPMVQLQVQFLSKLVVGGDVGDDSQIVNPELQVNSLRLVTELLKNYGQSCQWVLKWSNTLVQSLVVALASPLAPVRQAALDCLALIGKSCSFDAKESNWSYLVRKLLTFQEEIKMDAEQLTSAMQAFLDKKAANKTVQNKMLETLLSTIVDDKTPAFVSSVLLSSLKKIRSEAMFMALVPLGRKVLAQQPQGELDAHGSAILRNILSKLGVDTCGILTDPQSWQFVEMMMVDGKTTVWEEDGTHTCPAVLTLQQITGEFYGNLKTELQHKIFDLLIMISASTDQTAVLSAINHVVKVIILDASLLLPHLEGMKSASIEVQNPAVKRSSRPRRIMNPAPSPHLLQTETWKKGVTVLEFIQNKKKLHSVQLILPVLFDILKRTLEFEEQAPVEYTKQLLLSCMLHCLEKLGQQYPESSEQLQPEKMFNVELVIQCIRSTQNPQTQHHALLLVSHIAGILPEQVLHNMMSIFTFIGYSVLRLDDAYSFQIITKILDSVIPILIKTDKSLVTESSTQSCSIVEVLRVFADALLDVPVHRRLPIFQRLLSTMNTQQSLWIFLCLVLESHVLKGEPGKTLPSNMLVSERVEFCLELTLVFPPAIIMESCIHIINYLRTLPASKDKKARSSGVVLFEVEQHSPKQLRHFRYALSLFLCTLLSSDTLINKIASLGDDEIYEMESLYTSCIETVLKLIKCLAREADRNANSPNLKYWKIMLNQSYEMLNKVNNLLPSEMFLGVVRSLLDNKMVMVQRKAMELLNKRLQHQMVLYAAQPQQLATLLLPLVTAMDAVSWKGGSDPELELNQQTALLSLKLLARILAPGNPHLFVPLLNRVTDLLVSDLPKGNVLGSLVLFLAELSSVLKAHAIVSLPVFMQAVIKLLNKQRALESPNVVAVSVVTAVYKIVETLASFMSPYLDKLLVEICLLSGKWQVEKDAHHTSVVQKLKSTRQKISTSIPSRVLVPAVARCFSQLLKKQEYNAVGPLMNILSESFSAMSPSELAQHQPDLSTFFQQALQFRSDSSGNMALEDVALVEGHCVEALVALILKLSESYFKPLYYGLYHWAMSTESHKDRTITFYRVSDSIAEKLKGLCVLFAGHFFKNAADLLEANNAVKTDSLFFGSGALELATTKSELLLEYILKTLHKVFMYDSQKFINKERFNTLMQPIVDQLENTLGGLERLTSRATYLVVPCITQLAVAVADDALWKDLIYQVLLKMRHNTPEVRLVAIKALCEVVRILGDAFMPFLPETVPFLAELLEDEHEEVEKEAKKAVQEIEELIGEPLQKYF